MVLNKVFIQLPLQFKGQFVIIAWPVLSAVKLSNSVLSTNTLASSTKPHLCVSCNGRMTNGAIARADCTALNVSELTYGGDTDISADLMWRNRLHFPVL